MKLLGLTFNEFIRKGNVIGGIILAIFGVATWLLAVNITRVVRKTSSIKQNDVVLVTCRVIALVALLVGMVLIALPL